MDGVEVGVVEPSITCSQALNRVSDSGVSEKWENIEESESIDTRRREGMSSVYGGAGNDGMSGLDGGN